MDKKNDEHKRMTTREDEAELEEKEKVNGDEVREQVPPDQPPSKEIKEDAEREEDVQKQKDEKRERHI